MKPVTGKISCHGFHIDLYVAYELWKYINDYFLDSSCDVGEGSGFITGLHYKIAGI